MSKLAKLAAAVALVAVVPFGLIACGDGGGGKEGGAIKVGTVGPDSYDPVLASTLQALQPLKLAYTPLLAFDDAEGDEGAKLVPGLAEDLPEVSRDGRTYTFKLRQGLKYSDGTPVRASDFEHAVKRLLFLGGYYSPLYSGIKGAEEYQGGEKEDADISGITANDETGEIKVVLNEPDSQIEYALAQIYVAPTPAAKSPFKSLTKNPPPGVGPYKLKVVNPTREFILTRNKSFNLPGLAKGKIDTITGVVSDSVPRMTQDVIRNRLDFMTEDPTGDLLPEVRSKYGDRFREDANPPNVYYFFMNEEVPPFDNADARKAVNYGLDSRALVRVFGGRLKPSCNLIAPGMVGYEELDPCPYGDPNGPPDIDKARQLVEKSGTKGQEVAVWANNKDPRPAMAEYYADMLNEIGYRAKPRIVDEQVYFATVGNETTRAQTGFTNWFQDYPHPATFFVPLIHSDAASPTNATNLDRIKDPALDKKIDELKTKDAPEVADEWADLDRKIVTDGRVAPYGVEEATSFFSDRMNFDDCSGVHPVYKNDWALFCLK